MRQVWRAVREVGGAAGPPGAPVGPDRAASLDPAAVWEATALTQVVAELVGALPLHLRRVVSLRYGLADGQPQSFRQIGARLGCSGEWARQLHWAALVWLRQPTHSQRLRSWLDRHTLADYQWAAAEAQRWLTQRGGRHDH